MALAVKLHSYNLKPAKNSLVKLVNGVILLQIVPPKEWSPRANFSNLNNFKITTPIQQYVNGAQGTYNINPSWGNSDFVVGVYQQYNIQKKGLTFEKFKELAESSQ